jgi:hypothetical protein
MYPGHIFISSNLLVPQQISLNRWYIYQILRRYINYLFGFQCLKKNARIISSNMCVQVGFEVLTEAVIKSTILCDIALCSPLKVNKQSFLRNVSFPASEPKNKHYLLRKPSPGLKDIIEV